MENKMAMYRRTAALHPAGPVTRPTYNLFVFFHETKMIFNRRQFNETQ